MRHTVYPIFQQCSISSLIISLMHYLHTLLNPAEASTYRSDVLDQSHRAQCNKESTADKLTDVVEDNNSTVTTVDCFFISCAS